MSFATKGLVLFLISYKYTLKRLVTARVTWFLAAMGIGLSFGVAGYLPSTFDFAFSPTEVTYGLRIVISYILGASEVILLLVAIFAAFRTGSIFRDDLRDGSLLVMLSKPMTRSTLIMSRWLAFYSAIALYALMCALFHALGVASGLGFDISAATIFKGIGVVFGISMVFAWLFSGLSLLFSTFMAASKAGVATLSISLLFFPLSSLLSQATISNQADRSPLGSRVNYLLGYVIQKDGEYVKETGEDVLDRVRRDGLATLRQGTLEERAVLFDYLDHMSDLGAIDGRIDRNNATTASFLSLVNSENEFHENRLMLFYDLYLYVPSHEHDLYLDLAPIALSQQATSLSSYFVDSVYSTDAQSRMAITTDGYIGLDRQRMLLDKELTLPLIFEILNEQAAFSPSPLGDEDYLMNTAESYLDQIKGPVYTIRFENYMEPTYVLVAYLAVGTGMTLVSLFILRRRNFA